MKLKTTVRHMLLSAVILNLAHCAPKSKKSTPFQNSTQTQSGRVTEVLQEAALNNDEIPKNPQEALILAKAAFENFKISQTHGAKLSQTETDVRKWNSKEVEQLIENLAHFLNQVEAYDNYLKKNNISKETVIKKQSEEIQDLIAASQMFADFLKVAGPQFDLLSDLISSNSSRVDWQWPTGEH